MSRLAPNMGRPISNRAGAGMSNWDSVWHVVNVIIPRRSITGRLLWGTVLRRRDGRRWIYKKYSPASIEA